MDSKQLRYFREIVDAGSLSSAARSLQIAQPSLSQLVRTLEGALGVELLIRSSRGISPTEAGAELYEYARRIEALLAEAKSAVVAMGATPAGRVEFGMTPSISMALSIPMAETLRIEMPDIRFCASEAMSGYIREWVLAGEVELALLYDNSGLGDCISSLLLTEDLWIFSAAEDWPFAVPPGTPVSFGDLSGIDLVLPSPRHGLRTFIDQAARLHRVELSVTTEMDSLTQIKSLVARGSGNTILSQAAVHDVVADGQLVGSPIENPHLSRKIYLVRSSRCPATAASRAVEQCCREVVEDLVRRGIWQAHLP